MDAKILIGMGFVIFSSLTTQLTIVIFRHYPKMNGSELAEQYPDLSWIRMGYPVLSILWFMIFGLLPILLLIRSAPVSLMPFQGTLYILGGAIGSTSILHGLLGLITNVYPIPRKHNRQYVYDENMQSMALLLMATGVIVIIIALSMIVFYVI